MMSPVNPCSMLPRLRLILCALVLPMFVASLPEQFHCADPNCSGVISTATTRFTAPAGLPGFISIKPNKQIQILSKSLDNQVYGVSYQNQRGFVSANHVRENLVKVTPSKLVLVSAESIPWNPIKKNIDAPERQQAEPAAAATPSTAPGPSPIVPATPNDVQAPADSLPVDDPLAVQKTVAAAAPSTAPGPSPIDPATPNDVEAPADPLPVDDPLAVQKTVAAAAPSTAPGPSPVDPSTPSDVQVPADPVPVDEPLAAKKTAYTTTTTEAEKPVDTIESNQTANTNETTLTKALLPSVDPSQSAGENTAAPPINNTEPTRKPEDGFIEAIHTEHITNDAIRSKIPLETIVSQIETKTTDSVGAQNNTEMPLETIVSLVETKTSQSNGTAFHQHDSVEAPPDELVPEFKNIPPSTIGSPETKTPSEQLSNETQAVRQSESVQNTVEVVPNDVPENTVQTELQQEDEDANDASEELDEEEEEEEEEYDNEDEEEEEEEILETGPAEVQIEDIAHTTIAPPTAAPLDTSQYYSIPNSQLDPVPKDAYNTAAAPQFSPNAADSDYLSQPPIAPPTSVPLATPQYYGDSNTILNQVPADVYNPAAAQQFSAHDAFVDSASQPPLYPNAQIPSMAHLPAAILEPSATIEEYTNAPEVQSYEPIQTDTVFTNEPFIQTRTVDANAQLPVTSQGSGVGSVEELVSKSASDVAPPSDGPTTDNGPVGDVWKTINNWFGSSANSGDEKSDDPNAVAVTSEEQHGAPSSLDGQEIPIEIGQNDYCDSLSSNACPSKLAPPHFIESAPRVSVHMDTVAASPVLAADLGLDGLAQLFVDEVSALSVVFVYSTITGLIVVLFLLGARFLNNRRREQALLSKLNIIERKLMTSGKECDLLKGSLVDTKHKLTSIEDNVFGSNDMVISLRQELGVQTKQCATLREQVQSLETELETATEAGLELNKMVSELLNNQTGSDSIISSVEEMQRQLNEQEETTAAINALLADKSRENSELQVKLNDVSQKYDDELAEVVTQNERLVADYTQVQTELDALRQQYAADAEQLARTNEVKLQAVIRELDEVKQTYIQTRLANVTNEARVQVLEQLVKELRSDKPFDTTELMDSARHMTEVIALSKEKERLADKLDGESDARKLLEDHVKVISEEMNSLRQGFSLAEKYKLEAQTRLEVLSTYFKEKETQLQRELNVKEAITMKQQGETTSTVERIRGLQTDIQDLRSQNDSLKAEIEAQQAAHKAQMAAAENRAHESWISARQTQRRFEESLSEAAALRRKLTSLGDASGGVDSSLPNLHNSLDIGLTGDAPSPIHMDVSGANSSSNAALLMGVLPPPPFLPPPFMAPPPMLPPLNFMPPPQAPMLPFMPGQPLPPPPGEMRPPPLGRLMSPPPHLGGHQSGGRYSPDDRDRRYQRGDRYSPDEYDYDSEDDHRERHRDYRRHHSNRSPYETETDFSPPPSPEPPRYSRGGRGGAPAAHQPQPSQSNHHQSVGPYSPPPSSNPSSRTKLNNSKATILREEDEDDVANRVESTDPDNLPAQPFRRNFHSIRRFWNSMQSAGGLSSGSVDSLGSRKSHHGAKV